MYYTCKISWVHKSNIGHCSLVAPPSTREYEVIAWQPHIPKCFNVPQPRFKPTLLATYRNHGRCNDPQTCLCAIRVPRQHLYVVASSIALSTSNRALQAGPPCPRVSFSPSSTHPTSPHTRRSRISTLAARAHITLAPAPTRGPWPR